MIEKGLAPATEGIPLSPRERQCLELASRGLSSVEIGGKLGVAARTVDFHFSNMISKLGVHNRQEAIAKAVRQGLFAPSSESCACPAAHHAFARSQARSSAIEPTVASGASRASSSSRMRAVRHRDRRGARVARKLQIVRRVADHQRLRRARRRSRSISHSSMSGCGFG